MFNAMVNLPLPAAPQNQTIARELYYPCTTGPVCRNSKGQMLPVYRPLAGGAVLLKCELTTREKHELLVGCRPVPYERMLRCNARYRPNGHSG
jgi:hypothetical protein